MDLAASKERGSHQIYLRTWKDFLEFTERENLDPSRRTSVLIFLKQSSIVAARAAQVCHIEFGFKMNGWTVRREQYEKEFFNTFVKQENVNRARRRKQEIKDYGVERVGCQTDVEKELNDKSV